MFAEILIVSMMMNFSCVVLAATYNCKLPYGCEINDVQFIVDYNGNEKTSMGFSGVLCDIRNETFRFDYPMPSPILNPDSKEWCHVGSTYKTDYDIMEFRFPSNFILSKQFNFDKISDYSWYFKIELSINFVNLNGFELDFGKNISKHNFTDIYFLFQCIRCKIEFYSNGRHIKTCQDILDLYPNGNISSLFQIKSLASITWMTLFYSEFKTSLCPLVFNNSDISRFYVIGLTDTFYKRNILSIENRTFDYLNSTTKELYIEKAEKIKIDSNILNPSVFKNLKTIHLFGSFNKIDGNSLNAFKDLFNIRIVKKNYRDIIHKNGLKWIKDLNVGLDVTGNLSNYEKLKEKYHQRTEIQIGCFDSKTEIRSSKLFPDEDFCLYKDFPFNQLIILMEYAINDEIFTLLDSNRHFTCTYLWLAQYFDLFIKLKNSNETIKSFKLVLKSKEYESISTCNFEYRLSLCNKSTYQTENWLEKSDYYILNKKLQPALKLGQYIFALIGIVTNLFVVIIIKHKDNKETFKGLKHYSYLWLNSVFYLIILIIWLLSWINECFYPFEAFCPQFRKVPFIQFFKIIFKEVIVNLLKFMSNFTYVAFALNRIALIGKYHSKIVKFMSEVNIKVYIAVCFLISSSLSWIKYYRNKVNYFEPNSNFPFSNELDIMILTDYYEYNYDLTNAYQISDRFYFIYNSISDLINYVVFVIICIVIDVSMVIRMKQTLNEKLKKYAKENKTKYESQKKDNKDAIDKLIQMVVINTALGVLFKFPSSFMSIVNLYAAFYYRSYKNLFKAPAFGEFYSYLLDTGFYTLINDVCELLYIVSIAILFFIYKRFDKKFLEGYQILLADGKIKISNRTVQTISTKINAHGVTDKNQNQQSTSIQNL